jgi:hypothetical protein
MEAILIQAGIALAVAIISFFLGAWYQRRTDNKKRMKDFYLDYFEDLWMVVQNVNSVIQRNRKIDHQNIMHSIREKYSCADINAYLRNCVSTEDEDLKRLLEQFSSNLIEYEKTIGRLQYPSMGDGNVDYKDISNSITIRIKQKIDEYITI